MNLVIRDLGRCLYRDGLAIQESLANGMLAGDRNDYLLLMEHEPVYTLGRGADDRDLRDAVDRLSVQAYRTTRGGGVTFHGPGQLVAYPVIALVGVRRDIRGYIRLLEQSVIDCCAHFGVVAERDREQPGVWVAGAKIASLGIAVRRWITFHGVAINVTTDLSFFDAIIPCRNPDMRLTSLERELGVAASVAEVGVVFQRCFRGVFGYPQAEADVMLFEAAS